MLQLPLLAEIGVSRVQPCSSSPSASFWGYKTTQGAARIEETMKICFISLPFFFFLSSCRVSEGCSKPESSSRNNRTTEEVCACCSPGGWGSRSEKCGRCWWGGGFQQPSPAGVGGPDAASCSGPLSALLQWGTGAQHPRVAFFAPLPVSWCSSSPREMQPALPHLPVEELQ